MSTTTSIAPTHLDAAPSAHVVVAVNVVVVVVISDTP
jgi:hypothetical protein